ncbi:MAG: glyoxalase/bleomycin resistance protein/dioxygenase [Rhodospirillales bacterium]|nr:glyoxalase/bleomycin resistance protein/dioxygenase [Rhodospirillales bacterium]
MGRVVWFEIHADDPTRAIGFYEKLLGWEFTKYSEAPIPYWMIKTGDPDARGIDGGLLPRQGGSGDKVIAFVCTAGVGDLDATVGKATELGGQIVLPRMPIPGIGYLAYIKDTEGNVLGLMQPDEKAA